MRRLLVLFTALLVSASSMHVWADLVVTLSQPTQNIAAGGQLTFCGTLYNSSPTNQIFLNGIQLSGASAQLTLLSNTFYSNVPGVLLPGETYTGPLCSVLLAPGAPGVDYPAAVSFVGGCDIFAATTLASADLLVLSPTVDLVATLSSASEYGPVAGEFTVTRSGGAGIDLTVAFSISGTAVNGVTYLSIPAAVAIPAGSSSATVTITPITDDIAEGDRTAILTLSPSGAYNLGTNLTDTVIVHDLPADQWRFLEFGAACNSPAAADTASWAGDGVANLLKYTLGIDPTIPDAGELPAALLENGFLTISFAPSPQAIDVDWTVEASADLLNWSSAGVEQWPLTDPQPPNLVSFYYGTPVAAANCAFLRIVVTRRTQP